MWAEEVAGSTWRGGIKSPNTPGALSQLQTPHGLSGELFFVHASN